MAATRLVIAGAKGRMGQTLVSCAAGIAELRVTGEIDLGQSIRDVLPEADVVVDFSFHDATLGMAQACASARVPIVIGTTGHAPAVRAQILAFQAQIPMVWTSNFSTGVNTLFWLTRRAAQILGPAYDLEIVEMHHRTKKDAPSGTAVSLAEILAAVRGQQMSDVVKHGREGITGERTLAEIGMHSLRGGDVVGDHTVVFATGGERLELTHKASSRETFARGALRAALWIVGKDPGLYDMQDVLGLK